MSKLPVYKNKTLLDLSKDEHDKIDDLISKIVASMQFFYQRLHENPTMEDTWTHMGLFESYFKDLSPLVKYDSIMVTERENRFKEIREKNEKIRQLQSMLGKEITAEGVTAKLREYDDIVRLFYGSLGFEYASLESYNTNGIVYRFTPNLFDEPDDGTSSLKQYTPNFQKAFNPIIGDNTEYDVYKDTYHSELLDTDKNRKLIQKLMTDTFPDSLIRKWESRLNDFDSYSMSFTIFIPYNDIDNLGKRVMPEHYAQTTEQD